MRLSAALEHSLVSASLVLLWPDGDANQLFAAVYESLNRMVLCGTYGAEIVYKLHRNLLLFFSVWRCCLSRLNGSQFLPWAGIVAYMRGLCWWIRGIYLSRSFEQADGNPGRQDWRFRCEGRCSLLRCCCPYVSQESSDMEDLQALSKSFQLLLFVHDYSCFRIVAHCAAWTLEWKHAYVKR